MRKVLFVLVWGCGAVFWCVVCWRARQLSAWYYQWTERLQHRSRAVPLTPRALQANTRRITWGIRIASVWFALFSLLALTTALLSR